MSFTPPPVFTGENYHIWVVKMKTYLQAHDLWNVIENDVKPPPLRANPTIAQMRQHSEECTKKHKAMACLQNGASDVIFTRIMACDSPKQAWEKLNEEFMGSDKTRQQQLINLRRNFENLKMKESETIKQYSDRIMAIVNNIRLLGDGLVRAELLKSKGGTIGRKSTLKELSKQRPKKAQVCNNKMKVKGQQQMQVKATEDLQAQEEHMKGCSRILTEGLLSKSELEMATLLRLELIEKGYSQVFKNNSCFVEDSFGQVLVTVPMTDRCFMLDVNQLEKKAYTSATNSASLWHKRLGYVSYKSLGLLNRLNLVEDMSKIEVSDDVCEVCQLEVFEAFSKFKALVENQSGCKVKALRSDNGAEYLSEKFQKLCEQAGIHHQLTTVYTPQQNKVCE
ncbi:uncharacterized protein LOC108484978 [Gossypium arboreum]|uniref:uncharacterized protein LOC108484978 n=1 Tax=Gossypium arboreum TaxID=29729 RepID=UPI0008195903|nr:uncharacterized protein LOC108484978 [Gossypium arboreum]